MKFIAALLQWKYRRPALSKIMRIILGVGGGIAAYKSCDLASKLVQAGHEVFTVMTPSALQFVGPLTFRALTDNPVGVISTDEPMGSLSHVKMARWADLIVIAPLTQNLLARLSLGLSSDLLSLIFQGYTGPSVVAPAMESEMWLSPQTRARLTELQKERALSIVGPHQGRLASGQTGVGRMAEPQEIMNMIWSLTRPKTLQGRVVLVTTGATWEHFDPVRILTNPSTGAVGLNLARELSARGARVILIHGPRIDEPPWPGVEYQEVVSARDMFQAVEARIHEADTMIGAAAVSDFRPVEAFSEKQKKGQIDMLWPMTTNPDIMAEIGAKYHGSKILIGFAAETEKVFSAAIEKMRAKHLDAIVANQVGRHQGFGDSEYEAQIILSEGHSDNLRSSNKDELANHLADLLKFLKPKISSGTNS